MAGQMNAKIRLVRCPKCKLVLPELPNIPVYKCGGCGTVLQAKHRKTEARGTELCNNETDENGKAEPDHISEQKKICCLNQATIPSIVGSSAEASTSSSDKLCEGNIKQPGDKGLSDEFPISYELSCNENRDFSPELGTEQDKHIGNLDHDTGEGNYEFGDCCSEWHRARSFSDDFPSSAELTCHETEDSSLELQSRSSLDKDTRTFDHCTRIEKTEDADCKMEHDKGSNFLNKVSTTRDEHEENGLSPKSGGHGEAGKSDDLSVQDCTSVECKFPENVHCCRESSSFAVIDCDEHEKPTAVVEAKKEVDEDSKDHTAESLKVEDTSDRNETGSIYAAEIPLDESISVDYSVSLDNQHLELSQNIVPRGFERESSVVSIDKLPVNIPSSEVGMIGTDFSKSPTRSYYGYEASISSCDGNEDQIPGQFSKPPRRKFKHSAFTNSNGLHGHDESRVKDFLKNKSEMRYQGIPGSREHDMLSNKSEIRQQARKSSSILEEKNHYAMKYGQNFVNDLPEFRSYGHPGCSRIRVDKEEHASRLSFVPRYFSGGQRNGTPSTYQHNVFQPYLGFHSPDIPSYTEPDKKELLRMVYELKEELSRTHISKSRYSAGFTGEEMHAPLCYNHLAPAKELCDDLHYSRYPGRYSQATGLPEQHKTSRMAFSGDAADYRNQVGCSCLRGYPQDWHCSAQLPSHTMCCNKVHHVGHSGHTCYKGPYSASSSPQHYKSSLFSLYGCETKSDDQMLRDTEMKRRVKEKYYSSKRHLMPVAGGIPIVACYHCSELLQLPADFLLFGRRYHKLRCNACGKVMRYSLESGTHLSRNVHDDIAPPPPSMVDDCDDSIEQRDSASASHSSKHPHAEPLSCSDDYGLSFDRSCSTEGESSLMMPLREPLESKTRKTLSGSHSSFQPSEDRKMNSTLEESRETLKNSKENFRSEGPSSKMSKWGKSSSEIEELPPTSGSPLHRLMGYSSPSEVIKP